MSSFQGIETASRALRAFQQSLNTTGHNIANVGTAGYSRQVTELTSTDPTQIVAGRLLNIGTGVTVSQINRIQDLMLQSRKQSALGEQGRHEGNLASLEKVQSTFLDVDGKGISNALDQFYNSWSALGSDPSNVGLRQQVQAAGRDLTTKIRNAYENITALKDGQGAQISQTVSDIQTLAGRIEKLNKDIKVNIAQGGSPNDLLDQRDATINELSKLVNVDTHLAPEGDMLVFIGSFTLVDQMGARQFPTNFDATTNSVSDGSTNWPIEGGRLKGLFDASSSLDNYLGKLDTLANTLRTEVNQRHTAGTNPAGLVNQNFFNDVTTPPQSGAKDFALDSAVDSDINAISVGATGAAGDGSIALSIAQLRDTKISSIGTVSIGGYFNNLLGEVGRAVSSAKNNVQTAYSLTEQVDQQIQDISGVNLDEEMSNMLRFQRSYQAAAKVLNVMDQNMTDLINLIR